MDLSACNAAEERPLQEVVVGCGKALADPRIDVQNRARAHTRRGTAYLYAAMFSEAAKDFDQASTLDPSLIAVRINHATTVLYTGDRSRSVEIINRLVDMNSDDAAVLNARCWIRAALNELDAALVDCERALAIRPNDAATLDSRAFVRLKRMEYQQALSDYDAALRIGTNNNRWLRAFALFGRGIAERGLGNARVGDENIAEADTLSVPVRRIFADFGVVP